MFYVAYYLIKTFINEYSVCFNIMVDILDNIKNFVHKIFNVKIETFFAAIRLSPNAQGYLSGAITELLLKEMLEQKDYEVLRIKEKWQVKKHLNHHGDFYIRNKNSDRWFVLESKGVKSNSEKWHKLYNYDELYNFLKKHSDKLTWLDQSENNEEQIKLWIKNNLPKFIDDYKEPIYTYDEVRKYIKNGSRRNTAKSEAINKLKNLTAKQIEELIIDRLSYVMSAVRVLETHFVSGRSGASKRTQATPRNDEFNLISIDLFLREGSHKFVFANPKELDPSNSDANHLQQNYIIGFIFPKEVEDKKFFIDAQWYVDFETAFNSIKIDDAISEEDMQIDHRLQKIEEEAERALKTTR